MSTLPTGLTHDEVLRRRAAGQGNNVKIKTSRSYWEIFQENLITFINMVFFSLSAIMIALRRYGDAILVAVVILAGVVIGIVQEIWAKRKLDEIALLQRPTASVIREGKELEIVPSTRSSGTISSSFPSRITLAVGRWRRAISSNFCLAQIS